MLPTPRPNCKIGLLFWPRKTAKNGCVAVWRNISYTYVYGLWSGAAVWEVNAPWFGAIFVGNSDHTWLKQQCSIIIIMYFLKTYDCLDLVTSKISNSMSHFRIPSFQILFKQKYSTIIKTTFTPENTFLQPLHLILSQELYLF